MQYKHHQIHCPTLFNFFRCQRVLSTIEAIFDKFRRDASVQCHIKCHIVVASVAQSGPGRRADVELGAVRLVPRVARLRARMRGSSVVGSGVLFC